MLFGALLVTGSALYFMRLMHNCARQGNILKQRHAQRIAKARELEQQWEPSHKEEPIAAPAMSSCPTEI